MALPRIEVVSLSYNSRKYLAGYFRAFENCGYPHNRIKINILDNGSEDGSYDLLRDHFAGDSAYPIEVVIHHGRTNIGFAGGNNYLIRNLMASTNRPYFLLLNMDTEIEPGCVEALVDTMERYDDVGMVEAKQVPREHPKWYDPNTLETGWCSLGGTLVRKSALKQVGFLDEKFFMYCEDVDFSWRMWNLGWRCLYCPEARYVHHTEDLDKDRDMEIRQYYILRNSFFVHIKYNTLGGIIRHLIFFNKELKKQTSNKGKSIFRKARRDASKHAIALIMDRVKMEERRASRWIVFDGFNYERRRTYLDTEDGKRIIID